MRWEKRGRIYTPENMKSMGMMPHSQSPVPVELEDCIRIFFSCRPQHNLSVPTFLDVEKVNMKHIININKNPILELGKRGTFDEFGVIPTEVVKRDNELWMYYTGWQRGINITYTLAIGLAISKDNGKTFKRVYEGPVLDRTAEEPYMTMAPWIFEEKGRWHAFYASGIGFIKEDDKYEPQYIIKYADSEDGIQWRQNNTVIIPGITKDESNTRPTIIKIKDLYHMWFCFRGGNDFRGGEKSYQIGYAISRDLLHWERKDDEAGIEKSKEGWDSKIITYPYIRRMNQKYYMFYNGNGFGATGFGYAELDDKD